MTKEIMVGIKDLSVAYSHNGESLQALRDVSFDIPRGSTCAVIGPSGCGKSTLLYVLSGLLDTFSGRVTVDNAPVSRGRQRSALILQDYGLLPWKTVWSNASLGLEIRRVPAAIKDHRVARVLKDMGLWDFRRRYPAQLSGGQRQRTGIARALALEPDLLLMDEPFSSLDALTREALQKQLLEIWMRDRITIVLVTHSIEEATYLGQRIIVLSAHPGRVLKIVNNPRAGQVGYRKTAEFHELTTELRDLLEG